MVYRTLRSKFHEEGGIIFLGNARKYLQEHTASQARFLVEKLTVPQLSDKIPQILWNPKVHYRIHNSLTLVPVLRHTATFISDFPIRVDVFQNSLLVSLPYMARAPHIIAYPLTVMISGDQHTSRSKPITMYFSPMPCYVLPRVNHLPQHRQPLTFAQSASVRLMSAYTGGCHAGCPQTTWLAAFLMTSLLSITQLHHSVTTLNAAAPFSIGNFSATTALRVSLYELNRRMMTAALNGNREQNQYFCEIPDVLSCI